MYPPDLRHRDLFNVTQCIFDGIEGAVYVDDWQIDLGVVIRADRDKDNPRVTVEVWELNDDR
jgi:Holliday junction resolvase RusA-like endonuclease